MTGSARAGRVLAGLAALLALTACPQPPPEAPPEVAPQPEVDVWHPGAVGVLPDLRVEVPIVRATRTDEGWRVRPSIVLRHDVPMQFDGRTSSGRSVLVPLDAFRLVADGTELPPIDPGTGSTDAPGHVLVPYEGVRRALHEPAFLWRGDTVPDSLVLRITPRPGGTELPIGRDPTRRTADGRPAVLVTPVDRLGRAVVAEQVGGSVAAPIAAAVDGEPVAATVGGFLVPRPDDGARTVTLRVGERVLATVPVEADSPDPLPVALVRVDDPDEARLDALLPVFPPARERWSTDLTARALALGTPDAAAAWVRDGLVPLAAGGLRRSVNAVVRRGAGGPQERAYVLRDLLARLGPESTFQCGDLPPDEATALLADAAPVGGATELDSRLPWATLRPGADALTATLAPALAGWTERPRPRRARFSLVPEWCSVEWAEDPEGVWPVLDLRPGTPDTPVPHPWRSTAKVNPDAWRVSLVFEANLQGAAGPENVRLADRAVSLVDLSDVALVFDLAEARTPRAWQVQAETARTTDIGVRQGPEVLHVGLQTVNLVLRLDDPDGVGERVGTIELWQSGGEPPPRAVRVVVSGDSGVRHLDDVAQKLAEALPRRALDPSAIVLWARHDLAALVRDQLLGGAVTSEPTLWISILEDLGDGRVGWRLESWPPPAPAPRDGDVPPALAARYAAADALARAFVLGVEPPTPPATWMAAPADLGRFLPRSSRVQSSVARALGPSAFGFAKDDTLWRFDPSSGGLGWTTPLGVVTEAAAPDLGDAAPGDPSWPHRRWDRPVVCREGARWAAWRGVTDWTCP